MPSDKLPLLTHLFHGTGGIDYCAELVTVAGLPGKRECGQPRAAHEPAPEPDYNDLARRLASDPEYREESRLTIEAPAPPPKDEDIVLDSPDSAPPQVRDFEARGFERVNRHERDEAQQIAERVIRQRSNEWSGLCLMAAGMRGPDQTMRAKFEQWERDTWIDEIRAYGNREFARGIKLAHEIREALKGDDDERA